MTNTHQPLVFAYRRLTGRARDGLSLEEQQQAVEQYFAAHLAATHGWGGLFTDDVSSGQRGLRNRPMGADLFYRLEKGDVLLVPALHLAFRNLFDLLETVRLLKDRGVRVVLLDLAALGLGEEETFGVVRAFTEFARSNLSEQSRVGKQQLRAQNRYPGGIPCYGCKVARKNGRNVLVPHREERALGRKVVEWKDKGWSWTQITVHLLQKRQRNKRGTEITRTSVQRMYAAELRLQAQEQQADCGA